jgi:hypothetical protein
MAVSGVSVANSDTVAALRQSGAIGAVGRNLSITIFYLFFNMLCNMRRAEEKPAKRSLSEFFTKHCRELNRKRRETG